MHPVFLGFQKGLAFLGIVFLTAAVPPEDPREHAQPNETSERAYAEAEPFFAVPGEEGAIAVGVYVPHRRAYEALKIGWEGAGKPPLTVFLDPQTWKREEESRHPSAPYLRIPDREAFWPQTWELGLVWKALLQKDEQSATDSSFHTSRTSFRRSEASVSAAGAGSDGHLGVEELANRLQHERNEAARLFGRSPEEVSYLLLPMFPFGRVDVVTLARICQQEGMRLVVGQKTFTPHDGGREKKTAYGGGLVVLTWDEGATPEWVEKELRDLQGRWNVVPLRNLVYGENARVAPQ